jgi:hypothetical protein
MDKKLSLIWLHFYFCLIAKAKISATVADGEVYIFIDEGYKVLYEKLLLPITL